MAATILLVDDDESLHSLLRPELELEGFNVVHKADGATGLSFALQNRIDLAILDVHLPGLGGFEVCRKLRAAQPVLPIIMLTSRAEEGDKIVGFERGADDYVTKPFSSRELIARVHAALRRAHRAEKDPAAADIEAENLYTEGLEIQPSARKVFLDSVELPLTRLEFDLLHTLMQRAGVAVPRDVLAEVVWGNAMLYHDPTITATFSRLRRSLKDMGDSPRFIETVRGVGYRFAPAVSRTKKS